jgi:hypothetical protein
MIIIYVALVKRPEIGELSNCIGSFSMAMAANPLRMSKAIYASTPTN